MASHQKSARPGNNASPQPKNATPDTFSCIYEFFFSYFVTCQCLRGCSGQRAPLSAVLLVQVYCIIGSHSCLNVLRTATLPHAGAPKLFSGQKPVKCTIQEKLPPRVCALYRICSAVTTCTSGPPAGRRGCAGRGRPHPRGGPRPGTRVTAGGW